MDSHARQKCFLFLLVLSLFTLNLRGQVKVLEKYQMVEDMTIVQQSLKEAHPGLYWYKTKREVDSVFQVQLSKIPNSASTWVFNDLLTEMVDFIGCVHSAILPGEKMIKQLEKQGTFLPFTIALQDSVVIIDYSLDTLLHKGMKVLSIDGVSMETIVQNLMHKIPSDKGLMGKKRRSLELVFPYFYSMFNGAKANYSIGFEENGRMGNVNVKAISWNDDLGYQSIRAYVKTLSPFVLNVNEDYAYLKLQTFSPAIYSAIDMSFEESLRTAFSLIVPLNKKLVIDLRDNNGGSLGYGSLLYAYLTDKRFRYFSSNEIKRSVSKGEFSYQAYCEDKLEAMPFENVVLNGDDCLLIDRRDSTDHVDQPFLGPLYILTNGLTFSSAAMFTSFCKTQRPNTYVIGEQPGGAQSGCIGGGPLVMALPNSKLRLYFNLVKLNLNVQSQDAGITMDWTLPTLDNREMKDVKGVIEFVKGH
jgi:hypothetical protein